MMNEITRIHIAKTAYDIEIAAKKQLEKYIKSLETYTQETDVLADVEIRMTEILAERGVAAGGVIGSEDIAAVRAQLGEPYEFADEEGDISVGSVNEGNGRRFYRSTDNAVLGGVLSGIAGYFNVNPLWPRLVFAFLLFISFGFASILYIIFWVITPAARTATERLQLVGKEVTLESIKALNTEEETARPNRIAPVLQQVLSVGFGVASLLGALTVLVMIILGVVGFYTSKQGIFELTSSFTAIDDGNTWIAWVLFWVMIAGLMLLVALLSLSAYAFFARKLTKRMIVSGIVIVVLGVASVGTVLGVATTQSWRVADETRNMIRETNGSLPKLATAKSLVFERNDKKKAANTELYRSFVTVRYVVDTGMPRYELSALPDAKVAINVEGENATVSLDIPDSYRNTLVQPMLTIYGPSLETISSQSVDFSYDGQSQDALTLNPSNGTMMTISGSYAKVTVNNTGSVDLSASSVQVLDVHSEQQLIVTAGTVRELSVTQPDVCPSGTYVENTSVTVSEITSGTMTYNGKSLPAQTNKTSCALVTIGEEQSAYSE